MTTNEVGIPFSTNSDTSRMAAENARKSSPNVAKRIWDLAREKQEFGVTADEVIVALASEFGPTTITARMRGLKHSRLLAQPEGNPTRSTRRGREASVWVAVEADFFAHYKEPPPRAGDVDSDKEATSVEAENHALLLSLFDASKAWLLARKKVGEKESDLNSSQAERHGARNSLNLAERALVEAVKSLGGA